MVVSAAAASLAHEPVDETILIASSPLAAYNPDPEDVSMVMLSAHESLEAEKDVGG